MLISSNKTAISHKRLHILTYNGVIPVSGYHLQWSSAQLWK